MATSASASSKMTSLTQRDDKMLLKDCMVGKAQIREFRGQNISNTEERRLPESCANCSNIVCADCARVASVRGCRMALQHGHRNLNITPCCDKVVIERTSSPQRAAKGMSGAPLCIFLITKAPARHPDVGMPGGLALPESNTQSRAGSIRCDLKGRLHDFLHEKNICKIA